MYDPKNKLNLDVKGTYRNKTLRYIAPTLKHYGDTFSKLISRVPIRTITIGDLAYTDTLNDYLFLVVSNVNYLALKSFLTYIENKDYYVTSYIISLDKRLQCIVLKNPMPSIIDPFLAGKYSEMLTEEEINRFFLKTVVIKGIERYTDVYAVLTKRVDYTEKFKERLLLDFGTYIEDLKDVELDYPPIIAEEVLNTEEDNLLDLLLQQQNIIENTELWK